MFGGEQRSFYLSVVYGEEQGRIITGADGGGEELLFVSEPDTGPLQYKSHKKHISIWTQDSLRSHLFEHLQQDHVFRGQMSHAVRCQTLN